MYKKLFITTPIYYASGKPHIGHAYTTILADVIARYKREMNYHVFLLTGMDEHGQKILETAKKKNLPLKYMLDKTANDFQKLWRALKISPRRLFIRTTDKRHEELVQSVFDKLLDKGSVYKGKWEGLYCVNCEENYTREQAIKKDGKLYCKVGHELTIKNEPSYFLEVAGERYWIKKNILDKNIIFPPERAKELEFNFLNKGLQNLSITRTKLDWGIRIKNKKEKNNNEKHVVYVWVDALLSYLTGLGYKNENQKRFDRYWNDPKTEIIHCMSKEITRFHCIYWPILLKNLGLRLPTNIISHGWIVTPEGKMSKSLGNVIDPLEYIKEYGADAFRYFVLKQFAIWNDGIFSKGLFEEVYNSDLANNIGNMISRVTGMINKYRKGVVPKATNKQPKWMNDNVNINQIFSEISLLKKELNEYFKMWNFTNLLSRIQYFYFKLNKYIENIKPWVLYQENLSDELDHSLNMLFNCTYKLTSLLSPILVETARKVKDAWGIDVSLKKWEQDWAGTKIQSISPLFARIETKK